MNANKRLQVSLFIDPEQSATIEKVRREFNFLQYKLIPAHVTLCREDELEAIEKVLFNLNTLHYPYITINFGKPVRFSDGKGVLLPATRNNETFQQLRQTILQGIIENPRLHEPHITLLHPRNATCNDAIFEKIQHTTFTNHITFKKISLIEQEMGQQWKVVKEFDVTP